MTSRKKQAQSVFLTVIMVLSVVAMGTAGLAGSAAAETVEGGAVDAENIEVANSTVVNDEITIIKETDSDIEVGYNATDEIDVDNINVTLVAEDDTILDYNDEVSDTEGVITLTIDSDTYDAGDVNVRAALVNESALSGGYTYGNLESTSTDNGFGASSDSTLTVEDAAPDITHDTDAVTDEEALVNVSVDKAHENTTEHVVNESTINLNVSNQETDETVDLIEDGEVVNGELTEDADLSEGQLNVSVALQEGTYDISASAETESGVETAEENLGNTFDVDMYGDDLKFISDEDNPQANVTNAHVNVTTVDKFGNELLGVGTEEASDVGTTADDLTITFDDSDNTMSEQWDVENDPTTTVPVYDPTTEQYTVGYELNYTEVGDLGITVFDTDDANQDLGSVTGVQTFTGTISDIDVTADADTVVADEEDTVNVTMQLLDQEGNDLPRGGHAVTWASDNRSNAGIDGYSDRDEETTSDGQASMTLNASDSGYEVTMTALVDEDDSTYTESASFETLQGDAEGLDLTLNGDSVSEGSDPGAAVVDSDHELTVSVTDGGDNPVEGTDVSIDSNTSVVEETLVTDANGEVTTEFTLPTETGTSQIEVAANGAEDLFNITADPAEPDSLEFASDNIVVPAGESGDAEVRAIDEFGNFNDSGDVDDEVTLETDDEEVISVDGADTQSQGLVEGGATFTVDAAAESGSVTLSASADNLEDAETTATIGEPAGIDLEVDNESIVNDNVADAPDNANITAQLLDTDGNEMAISEVELRLTRVTSSTDRAATISGPTVVESDSDGENNNFEIEAMSDRTGETEFQVRSPTYDIDETVSVYTTDVPETVEIEANETSPEVNDTVELEVSIADVDGETVPVSTTDYVALDTSLGEFVDAESDSVDLEVNDGVGTVNLTSEEADTATIDAFVSAEGIAGTSEIEFDDEADDGEEHESGVSQELYDAADQDGDGDLARDDVRNMIQGYAQDGSVEDVDITRDNVRDLIQYYAQQ